LLLIVFGAGASYDSTPRVPPAAGPYTPPLANDLFDGAYGTQLAHPTYVRLRDVVHFLMNQGDPNWDLEAELQRLKDRSADDAQCSRQLMAVRYYVGMEGANEQRSEVGIGRDATAGSDRAVDQPREDLMEISKRTADRAIERGTARDVGTVVDNGWRWRTIVRLDLQRTDHVRVERALEVISNHEPQ